MRTILFELKRKTADWASCGYKHLPEGIWRRDREKAMPIVVSVNELSWGKRRGWLQRKNEKAQSARKGMFSFWTIPKGS